MIDGVDDEKDVHFVEDMNNNSYSPAEAANCEAIDDIDDSDGRGRRQRLRLSQNTDNTFAAKKTITQGFFCLFR